MGAAVVDFVLVGGLLTLMFLALVQVAIDVHVRNVLAACAADGARYGANGDVHDAQRGADQANALIRGALGSRYATARPGDGGGRSASGAPLVDVVVTARLPLLAWFLPYGPVVTVHGHAVAEPPG